MKSTQFIKRLRMAWNIIKSKDAIDLFEKEKGELLRDCLALRDRFYPQILEGLNHMDSDDRGITDGPNPVKIFHHEFPADFVAMTYSDRPFSSRPPIIKEYDIHVLREEVRLDVMRMREWDTIYRCATHKLCEELCKQKFLKYKLFRDNENGHAITVVFYVNTFKQS